MIGVGAACTKISAFIPCVPSVTGRMFCDDMGRLISLSEYNLYIKSWNPEKTKIDVSNVVTSNDGAITADYFDKKTRTWKANFDLPKSKLENFKSQIKEIPSITLYKVTESNSQQAFNPERKKISVTENEQYKITISDDTIVGNVEIGSWVSSKTFKEIILIPLSLLIVIILIYRKRKKKISNIEIK